MITHTTRSAGTQNVAKNREKMIKMPSIEPAVPEVALYVPLCGC
jgi:hypothetical protein